MSWILGMLALIVEVFVYLSTRDTSPTFLALVLVTLAIVVGGLLPFRRGA